jgi:hypothetical protein
LLGARSAVPDVTVGEYLVARPIGQTASLTGVAIVLMVLVAAWRQAPDWRVPPRWAREGVAGTVTGV